MTRRGSVVRADNIRRLTDDGWRALASHGVVRIVDLRWPEELAEDAPRDVDVEVVHVSVLGEGTFDEDYVERARRAPATPPTTSAEHYAWSYVDFLERYRDRFGQALAAIADADGPVVVHCVGGKDRTGLVARCSCGSPASPLDGDRQPTTRCRATTWRRSGRRGSTQAHGRASTASGAAAARADPGRGDGARCSREIDARYGGVARLPARRPA